MLAGNRAPRNRTIVLTPEEREKYRTQLKKICSPVALAEVLDTTIWQDVFEVLGFLPSRSFDLVFADPPYNLRKTFNGNTFEPQDLEEYEDWLDSWLSQLSRLLKEDGSIYVCGDWRSSACIHRVLLRHFKARNRITWEREKGRGAKSNWKNNSEDVWFATVSERYFFDVDAVKLKRRVIAPYTEADGRPKDWEDEDGSRYRVTYPSNLWTDLTVPFWSMPENTDHPTQKPEKLLAKVILASSEPGDVIFDPFLGSGTTSVVAKKLGRHYVGVETDLEYCCLAEKRVSMANINGSIQGYADRVFWERNSLSDRAEGRSRTSCVKDQPALF
jgi:site-specific DNA-methyltransferase (adenine-specific)